MIRYSAACCQTDLPNPASRPEMRANTDRMLSMIDSAVAGAAPFLPVRLVVFPEFAHAAPVFTTVADANASVRSGLTPDSVYIFRIRAVAVDAASEWSEEKTVVMAYKPNAPSLLSASAIDFRSVRLFWRRGPGSVKNHEIERRVGADLQAEVSRELRIQGPDVGVAEDERAVQVEQDGFELAHAAAYQPIAWRRCSIEELPPLTMIATFLLASRSFSFNAAASGEAPAPSTTLRVFSSMMRIA